MLPHRLVHSPRRSVDRAARPAQTCGRAGPGPLGRGGQWRRRRASVSGRPARATSPRPGASGSRQRLSAPDLEAARPGRRRAAGSRRGPPSRRAARRPPTPRSRSTSPPCSRGTSGTRASRARSSIRRAGPMPPHFASFTLTPATTPTSASRSSIVTALSSATRGSGDRSWSQRSWSRRRAGNGCSMSSTPSRSSSGQQRQRPPRATSRCWRRRGSARRTRRAPRSSVSRSAGPPTLTLSAGKSAARRARSATTAGSSMPSVKSVGGMSPSMPEQVADGQAEPLADEVVERDVDRALGGAVVADRRRHPARRRPRARRARRQRSPRSPSATGSIASSRSGHDGRHRPGRLAVERVRVALAEPDRAVGAVRVVAKLGEHRRRSRGPSPCEARAITNGSRSGRTSVRSRSDEGHAAAPRAGRGVGRRIAGDPRQRVDRRLDPAPQRLAAEADRVVARQPGLGGGRLDDPARLVVVGDQRGVERHGDDPRRRDQAGHRPRGPR